MNRSTAIKSLCLAAALLIPVLGFAQDANTNALSHISTNVVPASAVVLKVLPMHGSIAAVNPDAMTVTVGNSVLTITPKTRIFRGNKLATLADLKVGDLVNLSYYKAADGTLKAMGIRAFVHPPMPQRQPTDGN